MADDLLAILAQSILEIVRGMSYEKVTIGITGISRPILLNVTHPHRLYLMPTFFEKAQTKMLICPWALLWAFNIVCIKS